MTNIPEDAVEGQDVDLKLLNLPSSENIISESLIPTIWLSKRFFVGLLLFFGYVAYSMGGQVMNIAIVEMVPGEPRILSNQTSKESSTFKWNSLTVGIIINTFYYGSLFSPIGGYLSHTFGGATTFGVSMMFAGVVGFLTPFSLTINFYLFILFRILVGILESFCNASTAEIFAKWVPKKERSVFMACVINGLYFGTAATSPFCGYLIHRYGWPMSFYGTGIFCICWSLLWLILVRNSPSNDKWISKKERQYITEQGVKMQHTIGQYDSPPYKDILSSSSFWALSFGKFTFGGAVTFIVAYFPTYIKDTTHASINTIGALSSIPNFVNMFIIPIASMLMNLWQNHSHLKDITIQKIILSIGFILSSGLFITISIVNNFTLSIICFVLIKKFLSHNKVILELITVNMDANYSSTISGFSLFWQTVGTIMTQIFIASMIQNHKSEEWNTCFLCAAGALIINASVFMIYGSNKLRS